MVLITLTQEQINEIISDLQGTCQSLDKVIYDVTEGAANGLNEVANWMQFCDVLDNIIFMCAECGWWCEAGDYAEVQEDNPDGDVCSDCGPDEEEEEN